MKNKDITKKLRKKLVLRALLFCGILLLVNTYAWFIFITKVDSDISVSVASWDIKFKENDNLIRNMDVTISNIYPGMENFDKTITIINSSGVNAKFKCEIVSYNILGNEYSDLSSEVLYNKLTNDYPFTFNVSPFDTVIPIGSNEEFNISLEWPYESIDEYYLVNDLFQYNEDIDYYIVNNSEFEVTDIDSNTFRTLKSSSLLYVNSDDADSYYGSMCGNYQQRTGQPCLSIKLRLTVDQYEEEIEE